MPFQRVDHKQAGATAVGILIPPGPRTIVILRPRALAWDLLPIRIDQGVRSAFCQFSRDEAVGVARQFQHDLAQIAAAGEDPLVLLSSPSADDYQVGVKAAGYHWIACERSLGKPYKPLTFATQELAEDAARSLGRFFCPDAEANQQIYFNTQKLYC